MHMANLCSVYISTWKAPEMSTSRMELMVALKGGVLEVAVTSLFTEIAETSPSLTRSLLAEGIPALKMAGTTFFVGDTEANPAVAIWSSLVRGKSRVGTYPLNCRKIHCFLALAIDQIQITTLPK